MGRGNGGIVPRVSNRGTRRTKVFGFHPATLPPGKVPLGASEQEGRRPHIRTGNRTKGKSRASARNRITLLSE